MTSAGAAVPAATVGATATVLSVPYGAIAADWCSDEQLAVASSATGAASSSARRIRPVMAGHSGRCAPEPPITGRPSRPGLQPRRDRLMRAAGGPPPQRATGVRPGRRPCRGRSVSRAATGPQRSQASIGSATAPAKAGPVSDQTATSPTAPGASTPSSPARPRHAAPPSVAISNAIRAVAAAAPSRSLASSIAWRASSHSDPESADDEPSTPRPTCTPAARRATTGAMPDDRMRLLDGQWATPTPAAPKRRTSSGSGRTQWASHARSVSHPVRSRYSVGRQPKVATENSSSSAFSAKWVCSRTSRRSASSAERTISDSVTVNGEHGANAIRASPRGPGRDGTPPPPRWQPGCRRRRRPRRRAAGRRPSATATSSRAVGWKRTPRSWAASISAASRSPAPCGWR